MSDEAEHNLCFSQLFASNLFIVWFSTFIQLKHPLDLVDVNSQITEATTDPSPEVTLEPFSLDH